MDSRERHQQAVDALLDKIHEMKQRIEALEVTAEVCLLREEAIARVIALHVPNAFNNCIECGDPMPCPTFQALLPR